MDEANRIQASTHVHRGEIVDLAYRELRANDPVTLVIFGASGDLSNRKLLPALYHLQNSNYLPEKYAVVGFSRSPMTDESFRAKTKENLDARLRAYEDTLQEDHPLVSSLHYTQGDNEDLESFHRLKKRLEAIENERNLPGNRIYYLSVAPRFFTIIIRNLAASGLIHKAEEKAFSRVIVEKPFGHDLESARRLNHEVTALLDESQIYRIDHYLGKETVQNILSFRFGNSIFEPLFNQKYIDSVQITVAESIGMEGRRGSYYEQAGALRDMVQNHMLQLLCLIAMEPPSAMDAHAIRDEKVKVLRALVSPSTKEVAECTVRGQYGVGALKDKLVKGYRQEEGVHPRSLTETYVALRTRIDNWRWAGIPFYLRTGKRLRARVSEIGVEFRQPPLMLFQQLEDEHRIPTPSKARSNVLILRIQPNEGVSLSFACKRPGMRIELEEVHMDFYYGEAFQQRSPEAYERLLLDALRGDPSLFTRSDEVDYAWRFITAVHRGWENLPPPQFPNYYPFTDGPDEATRLMESRQSRWRNLPGDPT